MGIFAYIRMIRQYLPKPLSRVCSRRYFNMLWTINKLGWLEAQSRLLVGLENDVIISFQNILILLFSDPFFSPLCSTT